MLSIRRSLVLTFVLLSFAPSASAQTTEADFTRQMAERVRAALPGRTVEISAPLELRVRGEGDPATVNVGRIFNFCASSTAAECEESKARFVAGMAEGLQNLDAPITREQLRAVVRSIDYCDYIRDTFPADKPRPLTRPFVSGLCVLLMVDYPTRTRSADAEDVRKLGLDPDAAWALAQRQTLADLPEPKALEGLGDGIVLVSGFDYASSLLLNAEGWRAAAAKHGELLAAVPEANAMVVVLAAKAGDLAQLKAAVREHFETAERGVSPTVYRWTDKGWVPLD